jgi:hypothetical protein
VVHDVNVLNQQIASDKHRCYRVANTQSCTCECHNLEVNSNNNKYPTYTTTHHEIYNPWASDVDVSATGHDLGDFWANVRHNNQSPSTLSQVNANNHVHDRTGMTTQHGAWEVTTNSNCHVKVTNDGHCIEDDNADIYGNYESCTFYYKPVDTAQVTLYKSLFDVEGHPTCAWDYLKVGNTKYCDDAQSTFDDANTFPTTLALPAGHNTKLQYYTDGSVVHRGFKICDMDPRHL